MDLTNLNAEQRQAVVHGDDPLLVLAGAGTGKTTVITCRIARLMADRGLAPHQLLAVTFTNKAAREMRARAASLSGHDPRGLDIGTFHGMCGRLLRLHGHRLGLDARFLIYDEADQLQLIKRCAADMKLDATVFSPRLLRSHIERWKNQGLTPDRVSPSSFDIPARKAAELYRMYRKRCLEANAVDFGDLLLHTVTLLRHDAEVRAYCQTRWSHILVDEYQDTNPVQYQMIALLATERHSLTVVGDDDQSIYRWRGADIGNILRFERDFPGATVIRLEQNYRSTQTILSAANAVIANNVSRKGKTLFTQGAEGAPLCLRVFATERDEGEQIGDAIAALLRENRAPQEMAILYRINAQSRPLEDALRRRRIPYAIYGGVRFYDRREIKDALAYLRLLSNPRSEVDFLRIVNAPPRGIGKTSLERLSDLARDEEVTLLEASRLAANGEGRMQARARTALNGLVQILASCAEGADQVHPGRLLEQVLENSGYLEALRVEESEEAVGRIENLQELVAAVDEYVELASEPSLAGFLEEVTLATDLDNLTEESGQVSLMTLHSAKGLEFPAVFMPGMEEGIFPHSRSLDERAGLEEERRLCYVGLTRAKELLQLSAARLRNVFGELRPSDLSRFVGEIPDELLQLAASQRGRAPRSGPFVDHRSQPLPSEPTYTLSDTPGGNGDDPYRPGDRVAHATFGEGKVLGIDGTGKGRKLTIDFPGVGKKVVVARFVEKMSTGGSTTTK